MATPQPLPAIGKIVTFVAPNDDFPFTGRVVKDYGFAVAVAALSDNAALPMSVLEAGTPYTVIPSN
jgi:hypothetical protein